uniref:Uncharacterized protein n=1 Tax=Rangifer tarandus platyrhynchus TaxID=3082113 RepID=A0ACB0E382_RANTA|nr:unnamed protein product [Rangifer tarandus platyrhynchus]
MGSKEAPHCAFKGMTAASESLRHHDGAVQVAVTEASNERVRQHYSRAAVLHGPASEAELFGLRCVAVRDGAWCARWCVAQGSLGAAESVLGNPERLGDAVVVDSFALV